MEIRSRVKEFIEGLDLQYLRKWTVLGVTVGIIAGIGAIVFYTLLNLCTHYFLGQLAGYIPPTPGGEGSLNWVPPESPIKLLFVMVFGGLLTGFIVYTFAPEAEGHGTDAAIKAFHKEGGRVRARIPVIKTIASAITIGSGGSAGREGPTAQISAGFGSIVASLLNLNVEDRRLAVAIGIGAGIGSIFKAPLGGALLAAEILYVRDIEKEAIIPSLIAATIGYTIFCGYYGYEPIFNFPHLKILPIHLPFFILLGLICGIVGLIYVHAFYKTHDLFKKIPIPHHFKPAIGTFLAGMLILLLMDIDPRIGLGAIGMGYGFLQMAMLNMLPFEIMLLIAIAKIVTTSLTIGSGGSGGVFAPGLVIGGMTGGAVGMFLHFALPTIIPMSIVPAFVAVGMIALFGGISKAPLANMIMISEMTDNYVMIFPAMAAVFLSYAITGRHTIYIEQVETRVDSPAHTPITLRYVLEKIKVKDIKFPKEAVAVSPEHTILDVLELTEKTGYMGYPVIDDRRNVIGIITLEEVSDILSKDREEHLRLKVKDVMRDEVVGVHPNDSIRKALLEMDTYNLNRLPVLVEGEDGEKMVGIITRGDITRHVVKWIEEHMDET